MTAASRLLAFNERTGDFDFLTSSGSGHLNVALSASNVSISNQITGFATSAKQNDIVSKLEEVRIATENIGYEYLYSPSASVAELDFDTHCSSLAQGPGQWSLPLDGQDGWRYDNTVKGGASLYFYSNTSLVPLGQENAITLGSIGNLFCVANYPVVYDENTNKQFYMSIYTQPTGINDHDIWYHSRKVFAVPLSAIVSKGKDCFYKCGVQLTTIHKELNQVELALASQDGECHDTEIVQFMAVNVDSAVEANQFAGVIKEAGFISDESGVHIVKFGSKRRDKKARDNLVALTMDGTSLKVKDSDALLLLNDIKNAIGSGGGTSSGVVEVSNFPAFPSTQAVSGTVAVSNFPSFPQTQAVSGSVAVSNFPSFPTTQAVSGTVAVSNFPSFPTTQAVSGSVAVSNFPSFPTTQAVSGTVEVSNTFFPSRTYATSDGSSWAPLNSDNQGRLNVNLNGITTTSMSGTEQYKALDVSIKGTTQISGGVSINNGSVSVSNFPSFPATQVVSGSINTQKAVPVVITHFIGALAQVGFFGSTDVSEYSSLDILIKQEANSISNGGQLYAACSDNGSDWYILSNYSASLNPSSSSKNYAFTISSINTKYIAITSESPWGGGSLSTTNSIIKLSLKK